MSKETSRVSPSGPAAKVFQGSIVLEGGETTAHTVIAPTGSVPTGAVMAGSVESWSAFGQVGSVSCQRLTGGQLGVTVMFTAGASAGTLVVNATPIKGKIVE